MRFVLVVLERHRPIDAVREAQDEGPSGDLVLARASLGERRINDGPAEHLADALGLERSIFVQGQDQRWADELGMLEAALEAKTVERFLPGGAEASGHEILTPALVVHGVPAEPLDRNAPGFFVLLPATEVPSRELLHVGDVDRRVAIGVDRRIERAGWRGLGPVGNSVLEEEEVLGDERLLHAGVARIGRVTLLKPSLEI